MTKDKTVADALRRLLKIKVLKPDCIALEDFGATLGAVRAGIGAIIDILDPQIGIETDTADAKETGPENSREEVVGTSTSGTNRNFSSVGFSGGCTNSSIAAGCER